MSEAMMHITSCLPSWDTLVLTAPFLAILAMGVLGLDENFFVPKQGPRGRRSFCGVDRKGRAILSDPDGRPWRKDVIGQIEAKLDQAL
jgi:hypothetical protein